MEETHSKEFTFKAKTQSNSFYKSPITFNSKQLYSQKSSQFIPKQRSSSLPINPKTPNENNLFDTSKINQNYKRSRKNKIFDTNHSSIFKVDNTQEKMKVNQAYFKQSPKQTLPNNLKTEAQEDLKKMKVKIQSKYSQVNGKLDHSRDQINLRLSLIEKQKQISYLKLEVQRYKRCESLNKQNEDLYKKIVNKLCNSDKVTAQSFQVFKKRQPDDRSRTPINSLSDLKQAAQNQQSSFKYQVLNKQISSNIVKNTNTEPLKTIPQNDENHVLLTENCTEGWAKSQSRNQTKHHNDSLTNNKREQNNNNSINNREQKSINKTVNYQNNYFYSKMNEKLAYHNKRATRANYNEIPISVRLQEMNKAIQKSFQVQIRPQYKYESPYKLTHKRDGSKSKYGSSFHNTNSKLDSFYY